ALMPFNERDRLAAKGIGQILLLIDLLRAAENPLIVEIIVRAAEEAKKFVEAAFLRMELRLRAEMPLANEGGGIAGGFEARGDRRFGDGQAAAGSARIELVAEPCLI